METEVLAASERADEVSKEGGSSNIGALDMMWHMRFMDLKGGSVSETHGGDTPLNDSGVRYSTVEQSGSIAQGEYLAM